MGNAKVIFGNETLIDLTGDTVSANNLLSGATAHDRSGTQIVGTVTVPDTLDDLTDVTITSATNGQALVYDGSKWVNATVSGVPSGGTTDQVLAKNSNTAGDTKWMTVPLPDEIAAIVNVYGSKNLLENKGVTQIINGVTFTVNSDGSITVSGKATGGNAIFPVSSATYGLSKNPFSSGDMILSGCPAGGAVDNTTYSFWLRASDDGVTEQYYWAEYGNGKTIPYHPYINVYIRIQNGYEFVSPMTFYPMLRDARIVDGTYAPYAMTNKQLTDNKLNTSDFAWKSVAGITANSSYCSIVNGFCYRFGDLVKFYYWINITTAPPSTPKVKLLDGIPRSVINGGKFIIYKTNGYAAPDGTISAVTVSQDANEIDTLANVTLSTGYWILSNVYATNV